MFLRPRIMKLPVDRYSPAGAVFDTWLAYTHHALLGVFAFHAAEKHTVNAPASSFAVSEILSAEPGSLLGLRMITVDAPCKSACTYKSWPGHARVSDC